MVGTEEINQASLGGAKKTLIIVLRIRINTGLYLLARLWTSSK